MSQPMNLTEDEKIRLGYALAIDEDDEDEVATLKPVFAEVEEIIKRRLAAAVTTVVVADLTLEGVLPLPAISWHALSVDQFKQVVAAFPDVEWVDNSSSSPHLQYVVGEHAGVRMTVWAPAPRVSAPAPKVPSYAAMLLAEVRGS